MAFRFIHTADLHLDSPLRSLALRDPQAAEAVANATRQAFSNIVDLCLSENVDALLIAGDVYDGELKNMKTAAFFTRELARLNDADIPAFLIRGNHDAASKITKHLELPENTQVFGTKAETKRVGDNNVYIHGVSFADQKAPDNPIPSFNPPEPDAINIGMLHTSLSGSEGHDTYAPCALSDLINQGYDYWALGHIHKRQVHNEANPAVVMPGNPQGRHINESGDRSVTLVDIDENGTVALQERDVSTVRFERLEIDLSGADDWTVRFERLPIDLSGADDWADALKTIDGNLPTMPATATPADLILRITLTGKTDLSYRLLRDADVLREEITNAALTRPGLTIEKVENKTTSANPTQQTDESGAPNPLVELSALMSGDMSTHPDLVAQMEALISDFQKKLPPELRQNFGDNEDGINAIALAALRDGSEEMVALLSQSGDT